MKPIIILVLSILYLTATSCNDASKTNVSFSDTRDKTTIHLDRDISLITLIANPNAYNGRKVRVIGYLNLEFEGNGLYLHKEDYEKGISKNGLWVEISRDSAKMPSIRKTIKNYVLIEGTFDTSEGHMSAFSGSIKNITRIENWYSGAPTPLREIDKVRFPNFSPTH